MTDEQIEQLLEQNKNECFVEFYSPKAKNRYEQLKGEDILNYIYYLKCELQHAETHLDSWEKNYEIAKKQICKETAEKILREIWFGSVFTYTNINGCGEQCENLIRQFDNVVKEVAKEYGIELDNE